MKMPWTPDPPDAELPDDDSLVADARTNPAAFADPYERYRPSIYGFAFRRLGDPHQAEDVTSQVFLRALRGLSTYRSGSFRGWLFQIARNTIADSYRRERPATSDDALAERADPQPGPLELSEIREAREQVRAIVDQLTGNQRDIIHLRLRGHTGQEIADELGMGLAAAKSAQYRAFEKIRKLMTEMSPDTTDDSRFRRPDR